MGDLRSRIRKTFRRHSTASSLPSLKDQAQDGSSMPELKQPKGPRSLRGFVLRPGSKHTAGGRTIDEKEELPGRRDGRLVGARESSDLQATAVAEASAPDPVPASDPKQPQTVIEAENKHDSTSTADFPTPNTDIPPVLEEGETSGNAEGAGIQSNEASLNVSPKPQRPAEPARQQSLLAHQEIGLLRSLLDTEYSEHPEAANLDHASKNLPRIATNMVNRKIWVKRPGASATLVTIHEDDLVDDVRDMILKKYANSLGRSFDAPDVTLRICPRENIQERTLGPEEEMSRTLDAYYPGGQKVDDALIIDVPLKRTPKPSPQPSRTYYDDSRPLEGGTEYFPPMPIPAVPSPRLQPALPAGIQSNGHHIPLTQHSMSVLTTGQVPALPSPSGGRRPHHSQRPRVGRQHTSSPTVIGTHSHTSVPPPPILEQGMPPYPHRHPHSRTHSSASEQSAPPAAPPLPTPPAPQQTADAMIPRVATPPPRVASPRPKKKSKKAAADHPSLPSGMLNSAVPPINVLIVEDNIINLKLLGAFMKRLKVRWQTAMNGRDAVTKWRGGGFHLVLMDIQLPIMSGLEATKEIRRLERLNGIGVFSGSAGSSAPPSDRGELESAEGDDKLPGDVLFKSPVIIVALTASSLQSDRHEALAAGCNDFLTKPVNFVWLERKVMEWGCMQALIDFDGWRKWKDFSQANGDGDADGKDKKKKKAKRMSTGPAA